MTCNHDYIAGACQYCGQKQPTIRNGREVSLSGVSDHKIAYKPPQAHRKRITSEFQMVVDEIMTHLGEDIYAKGLFSRYCGIIKRVGINQARIWIKEMRGRGITSPAYFLAIYKQHNKQKNGK